MNLKIGVIKGDGIGPEIVTEAMKVLDKVAKRYGHNIEYRQLLMGGASIDVHGVPLTDETVAEAKSCDAVLMGSIGGNTSTSPWYKLEPSKRPEAGLLRIRKELNLFANLRPAILYDELKGACPLKEEITEGGFDLMIMRELTGGLYFGERKTEEVDGVMTAFDSLTYNENEIRRIAKRAFDIAMKRRKKVTSVDKANVLDSSRLWRKVVEEVAKDYPEVTLEHMLVDNSAMQLVKDPKQFDVILTENMFGDILSDEASMITGSIGTISSLSSKTWMFLILSGIATGVSWLCYFKALQLGDVNKVVPIDKSSTILTIILAFIFLGEPITLVKGIAVVLIGIGTFMMIQKKETVDEPKKPKGGSWLIYALLSTVFASLTAILGKVGIEGVESNLGTAIRTCVVLVMAWVVVFVKGKQHTIREIPKNELGFICLSGLATGGSWLCYYRALHDGMASVVVPIDKLSILVSIAFSYIVFRERLTKKAVVGLCLNVAGTLIMLL